MFVIPKGWEVKKRDSLLNPGITEMAYLWLKEGDAPWAVVADHTGVTIRGESPKFTQGGPELDAFAQVMGEAMKQYIQLRRTRIQIPGDNEVRAIK